MTAVTSCITADIRLITPTANCISSIASPPFFMVLVYHLYLIKSILFQKIFYKYFPRLRGFFMLAYAKSAHLWALYLIFHSLYYITFR